MWNLRQPEVMDSFALQEAVPVSRKRSQSDAEQVGSLREQGPQPLEHLGCGRWLNQRSWTGSGGADFSSALLARLVRDSCGLLIGQLFRSQRRQAVHSSEQHAGEARDHRRGHAGIYTWRASWKGASSHLKK